VSSESETPASSPDPVDTRDLSRPEPPTVPTARGGSPSGRAPSRRDRLRLLGHLTARDRAILGWLAEHYLLTTAQIAQAAFPSPRAAGLRLSHLHKIEAVNRFVDASTGTRQHLYALGALGQIVHPTRYNDPDRYEAAAPRSSVERTERIVGSRKLAHLLGTNQLFVDLLGYARTDTGATLLRWWSEQRTTNAYTAMIGIRPDAHGIWRVGDRTVGFWLEHDRGTEPLDTVLRKLRNYARLGDAGGPRYPVLLRVPSRRRENNLLDALAGLPPGMPVATGLHDEHPAGPAWTLAGDRGRLRRWLHELPSDHGPVDAVNNPHRWTDPTPDRCRPGCRPGAAVALR
jgi:DNA-binding CsgD family transcriptional regulator